VVLRNFESLHPSTDLVQLPTSSFTKKLGADPAGMGALMFSSIVGCGVLRELTWANNACTAGLFQMSSLSMEGRSEPHPTCSPHRLAVPAKLQNHARNVLTQISAAQIDARYKSLQTRLGHVPFSTGEAKWSPIRPPTHLVLRMARPRGALCR
jgi:hypothetical protein